MKASLGKNITQSGGGMKASLGKNITQSRGGMKASLGKNNLTHPITCTCTLTSWEPAPDPIGETP